MISTVLLMKTVLQLIRLFKLEEILFGKKDTKLEFMFSFWKCLSPGSLFF